MTREGARRQERKGRERRGPRLLKNRAAPAIADRRILYFHWIVVAAAAATVVASWPLWQLRSAPPMIPLLPLPAVGTGLPLLAALAWAALRPGPGLAAYALVLGYAIATDWTRLQPAFVSFALLLAAGLPGTGGLAIARAHLLTLWFYAGIHKLLSPEFMADTENPRMLRMLFADAPPWVRHVYPEAVVLTEVGLALAAAIPATRKVAALWACVFHAGVLLSISPLGDDWNDTVWAWNAVLAVAGFLLIAPWKEGIRETFRAQHRLVQGVLAFLALFPAASQVGLGDLYLAHQLYSRSTPISYVCRTKDPPPERPGLGRVYATDDGRYQCRFLDFFPSLDVPEPSEHGFARAYFTRTCERDEILFIRERRWFYIARGEQWSYLTCPGRAGA